MVDNHSDLDGKPKPTDVKVAESDQSDQPGSIQDEQTFQFDDSRKLGVTSAVFVIINKMIGTGIFSTPSGIFAATGSVGVSLFLWIIGTSIMHFLHRADHYRWNPDIRWP